MSSYPVPDAAVPVSAGMIVAVPAKLLASPLKNGRDLGNRTCPRWSSGGRRGWEEYPGSELAALYKWRWDGSETGLRKSKSPSTFAHAGVKDTITRIAPAVITMANTPA